MSGVGYGHGGPVGEILAVLPTDSTFHVTDCGYDDHDGRCGCYDLPSKLHKIVSAAQAEALRAAAADLAGCADAGWSASQIVTALHNRGEQSASRDTAEVDQ